MCKCCDCENKSDYNKEVGSITIAIVIAAFTWIVAVSWYGFLDTAFKKLYFYNTHMVTSRLVYAILITVVAIFVIYLIAYYFQEYL